MTPEQREDIARIRCELERTLEIQRKLSAYAEDADITARRLDALDALLAEHAAMDLELRNVKALAKRMRRYGDEENAKHLLRFCARVGLGESPNDLLRGDHD